MTIVDGDYLRVTMNFELGGGVQYQNIYTYTRDGPDPVSDAAHIAGIKTKMEAAYDELVGYVKDDTVEQLCFVDQIAWSGTVWEVIANVGTFTPTWAPVATGDALPFQSAPFIVYKTTRPKSVGKKFLFPFDEASQAGTVLVAGAVTAMVAMGAEILADIPLLPDNVLIVGITRTAVEQWLSFQVAVVNDVIGSQKRRRPGVGA